MTPAPSLGGMLGLAAACGLILIVVALTAPSRPRRRGEGRLRRLLVDAGLPHLSRASVMVACLACGVLAAMVAIVVSALPVAAILAGIMAGTLPVVVLRRRAARRRRAVRASWPDAVDVLVSGVRAGMSLPEALGGLAVHGPEPLRSAFAGFEAEHWATGSFPLALDRLQSRLADPVADRVIASLRIARDVGGSDLGRVLRTLSTLLREDARMRGEIESRQSWTVSAARMAVAAPWVTLALLCTRPEAVQAYRSPAGAVVLVAAALISVAAYLLMMRIGRLPAERRLSS
jgi:tight adherence protein B